MLTYNYKEVDWKAVKQAWDNLTAYFQLEIKHQEVSLSFQTGLDKSKRFRIIIYINGSFSGAFIDEGHPNYKYLNQKLVPQSKRDRETIKRIEKFNKRVPKARRILIDTTKLYYRTPIFDNVAQIKKMVAKLE